MATQLLQTKLFIPPQRAQLVGRPHLVALVRAAVDAGHPLIVLSAPDGYGKTTLLGEWARTSDRPVAWLLLDEADNVPDRFWADVFASVHEVLPWVGDGAQRDLASSPQPSLETILNDWADDFNDGDRAVLVLDDYDIIKDPAVHRSLVFLLEHCPPGLSVIIAGRAGPPLPLNGLPRQGAVTALRTDDLRFSQDEAGLFVNRVFGLDLTSEQVACLAARTGGRIICLQLAALALRWRDERETDAFLEDYAACRGDAADCLVGELLARQPPEVREFLLRTSILQRLTGDLCDAVVGIRDEPPSGPQVLAQLEAANVLVRPLDGDCRWFVYHPLFAAALRRRLLMSDSAQVPALHQRASRWYEAQGLVIDAVRHALAAGDAERVAQLVGGNALALMQQADLKTVASWLGALDGDAASALPPDSSPWLAIARAWVLAFTGYLDAVEPLLQRAETAVARDGDGERGAASLVGHIAAVRGCVAGILGRTDQAMTYTSRALANLTPDDTLTRSWATLTLAIYHYRQGEIADANGWLAQALQNSRRTGASHIRVLILCAYAITRVHQGQLRDAAATFHEALHLARLYQVRTGSPLPVAGCAYAHLAGIMREWNDLDGAETHMEEGIRLCEQWGEPQLLSGAYLAYAELRATLGDDVGALAIIARARQVASTLSPWFAARGDPLDALIRLRRGNIAAAVRWAATQYGAHDPNANAQGAMLADLVLARVEAATDHAEDAVRRLSELAANAGDTGQRHFVIQALVQRAVVLEQVGEREQALASLARALLLGEPQGYVRTFVEEGEPMEALLAAAVAQEISPTYARKLLAALAKEKQRLPVQGGGR